MEGIIQLLLRKMNHRCSEKPRQRLIESPSTRPAATVRTSALHGAGIDELLQLIEQLLLERQVEVECRIPYSAGDVLADIRKLGTVVEVTKTYNSDGEDEVQADLRVLVDSVLDSPSPQAAVDFLRDNYLIYVA